MKSLSFYIVSGIALPLLLSSCNSTAHLTFKKGDLEYNTKQVTEDQAQKMGDVIVRSQFFNDKEKSKAKLEKPDSLFILSIFFPQTMKRADQILWMKRAIVYYSEDALKGAPIDAILTSADLAVTDTLHYRTLGNYIKMSDESAVFYTEAAGLVTTKKLLGELTAGNFFKHGPKLFRLDKNAHGYIFELCADPKAYAYEMDTTMREAATYLSSSVLDGIPLTYELCDVDLKPFHVITP